MEECSYSISMSSVMAMCSTLPFRILQHRLNHCVTFWALSRLCATSQERFSNNKHCLATQRHRRSGSQTDAEVIECQAVYHWEAVECIVKAMLMLSSRFVPFFRNKFPFSETNFQDFFQDSD